MTRNPIDTKQMSRGVSADMSPEAVTRRLKICSEMSDVCRRLGKATPVELSEKATLHKDR